MTNIVVLSGGMDSTAALALAVSTGERTRAVSFDYGQRHRRELRSAEAVAIRLHVPHRVIDLRGLLHGSALLDDSTQVPEGHYAEDSMSATVVNGRNLLFASAAIGTCNPGDSLWVGVHAGDHPVYADCRPAFWEPLTRLVLEAYKVRVITPFLDKPKAEIAVIGTRVGAPFDLSWSCYKGGDVHCGRCGTCVERAEAFDLAGIPDPTEYADPDYWVRALGRV